MRHSDLGWPNLYYSEQEHKSRFFSCLIPVAHQHLAIPHSGPGSRGWLLLRHWVRECWPGLVHMELPTSHHSTSLGAAL